MVVVLVVVEKIAVEIRVGARGPLGVGGAREVLRPVGHGMLASRYVHKAELRDGRGNGMVVVVVMKWYRYRHREQQVRSAPPAAQLSRARFVYPRNAYHPRARAIVYILT
jgi:hypothetical protein